MNLNMTKGLQQITPNPPYQAFYQPVQSGRDVVGEKLPSHQLEFSARGMTALIVMSQMKLPALKDSSVLVQEESKKGLDSITPIQDLDSEDSKNVTELQTEQTSDKEDIKTVTEPVVEVAEEQTQSKDSVSNLSSYSELQLRNLVRNGQISSLELDKELEARIEDKLKLQEPPEYQIQEALKAYQFQLAFTTGIGL